MDEATIKTEMRFYVLECLVTTLFAAFCGQCDPSNPSRFCESVRDHIVQAARQRTWPQFDPTMSDLLSAELEGAATRLLRPYFFTCAFVAS